MSEPRDLRATDVAIVMPAYNEAEGIGEFLCELDAAVAPEVKSLTFVVVEDCATDDTAGAVERVRPSLSGELRLVRNEENRGHGPTATRAYREGLATGAGIVVHVDGDGQYRGDDMLRVVRHVAAGADAVIGRRQGRTDPWFRRLLTGLVRVELYTVARVDAADPNCPLRGYDRAALTRLLDALPADTRVPNIYMSVLESRLDLERLELPAAGLPRRSSNDTGTMWGGGGRRRLPPRRLVDFVVESARESFVTIPRLGRSAPERPGSES